MEGDSPGYSLFLAQKPRATDAWPTHHKYEFEAEAATGGTATVWRAFDSQLGRYVAVKVLLSDVDSSQMRSRLEHEAFICARLDHLGIVPVLEYGLLDDGRPFIAMKWIEGSTLGDWLDRQPKFNAKKLDVFKRICEIVRHAHDRNVIHRDLKPANVFVDKYEGVHVVDWGLAKFLGTTDHESLDQIPVGKSLNTCYGAVLGTPAYMSPEQANGDTDNVDKRSDVFALGCILYRMLTGEHVYEGDSHESICSNAAAAKVGPALRKLKSVRAKRALRKLTADCLNPDRMRRPADASEVLVRLDKVNKRSGLKRFALYVIVTIMILYAIELTLFAIFGRIEITAD